MWVEAEPVAQGVKGPNDRDYFHRYKVRFDWVQSQGTPWWLQAGETELSASSNPVHVVHESALGSTLSSVSMNPFVDPRTSRECASASTLRDRLKVGHLCETPPNLDLNTGLLTPPITPPQESKTSLFQTATDEVGPSSRRIPGSYPYRRRAKPCITMSLDSQTPPHDSCVCPSCARPSPRIYREGWICVIPTCNQFWLITTSIGLMPIPPSLTLSFEPSFLQCALTPTALEKMPYDIVPPLESAGELDAGSAGFMRGWVCSACERANSRYRWEVWECSNCKQTMLPISPLVRSSVSSLKPLYPAFIGDAQIHPESGITVHLRLIEGVAFMEFAFPRK